MRRLIFVVVLFVLASTVRAQQPGRSGPGKPGGPEAAPGKPALAAPTTPTDYQSDAFEVKMTAPAGWAKTEEGPKAAGAWVTLVRFEEPRTKAQFTLSYQASPYRTSARMFEDLRNQFRADASLAILRNETRTATEHRPEGIFFEYTFQGKEGVQHAVAAYWLHLGRRYRVYGSVKEVGWRTVGGDMESMIDSLRLTDTAFAKDNHNFRDEPDNFMIYFPESFRIRLPEKGAKVVFESDKLGVGVYVYVSAARGDLAASVARVVEALKSDDDEIGKQRPPATSPTLGIETALLEYSRKQGSTTWRFRETLLIHRDRLYRIVLAASDASFAAGEEHYTRMVRSIAFLK
jgi:hypothetical protein